MKTSNTTTTTITTLMAIFQVNLGQPVLPWFLPPLVTEENQSGRFFYRPDALLTPNHV